MHMFASLVKPTSFPELLSAPAYAVTGRHESLREALRPANGALAVTRDIASPFEQPPRVIDITDEAISARAAAIAELLQSTMA
jgi:hypothetical protein